MAEYRQIHTHIWRDDWFLELSPAEKLLFVYLFSNDNTNVAGIYKLSLRHARLETGLDADEIGDAMQRFEADGKIVYLDGYVWVRNLRRYNASRSPKTTAAIDAILNEIPDCEIKRLYMAYYNPDIPYQYPIDSPLTYHNSNNTLTKQNSYEERAEPAPENNGFTNMRTAIETLTGYPISHTPADVEAINAMIAEQITADDLAAAVAFHRDKGIVARGASALLKSARYNKAQRTQASISAPSKNGKRGTDPDVFDRVRERLAKNAEVTG